MFAHRGPASHVVPGEPLQAAGRPGSQLVGVDHRARVRCRNGGIRVQEFGLVEVLRAGAGGYGGEGAVF